MIKKIFFTFVLFAAAVLPSFAAKEISSFPWGKPEKVEVLKVYDALQVRIKFDRMRVLAYVSHLDCHEYSKTYTLKSTKAYVTKLKSAAGNTYVRPSRLAEKLNTRATDYVSSVFEKYPDDIYFVPDGYGLFNNFVGEFYIGDVSLNQHLIEKGYCSAVE